MTEEVITTIFEKSARPPIIVVQGDHGSGLLLDVNSAQNTCLRERTAILNAYYIPSIKRGTLYDTITPVNTFRIISNEVFGLQLSLLDDRSFFSTWDKPYQVKDVTNEIESVCTDDTDKADQH